MRPAENLWYFSGTWPGTARTILLRGGGWRYIVRDKCKHTIVDICFGTCREMSVFFGHGHIVIAHCQHYNAMQAKGSALV